MSRPTIWSAAGGSPSDSRFRTARRRCRRLIGARPIATFRGSTGEAKTRCASIEALMTTGITSIFAGRRAEALKKKGRIIICCSTRGSRVLEFVARFAPSSEKAVMPTPQAVFSASKLHWKNFWTSGAAIDLSGTADPRAKELERRVVLSQYLTAIQCSGSLPPQETGLTCNSWYGKFHLEMHWWHAAHFALWRRLPMLEKSLGWYDSHFAGRDRARKPARLRRCSLAENDRPLTAATARRLSGRC